MEITTEQHTCPTHGCGLVFWVTEAFGARRRQDHLEFYCPNGHSIVYKGETDAQKLTRITREKNVEIERLQKALATSGKRKRGRPRKTS
jgi:hypothetical protein